MATGEAFVMKLLVLLFLNFVLAFGAEHVPVLIWQTRATPSKQVPLFPSLSKLSSDSFSDFFIKKVSGKKDTKPLIAAFVEENLSVEDFSWQDAEGHVTFPLLENLTSSAKHVGFFPSVHAPLKSLKRLGYRWQSFPVEAQESDLTLPSDDGVVLVVKLGDARIAEDRPDFLRRHDKLVSEIYNGLTAKHKDVIALYTSRHSSRVEADYEPLVRRSRSVSGVDEDPHLWNDTDVLFYSLVPPVFSPDESRIINITKPSCQRDKRAQSDSLKCKFDDNNYTLELRFTLSQSYWYMSVYISFINNTSTHLSTETDISAPLNFSYHCSQEVVFRNGSLALRLRNFQIQPFTSKNSFDDAYDCVYFFTAHIWTGLLVSALLGFILILGLAMIMDINTMDRFDDPKGKTITINVSE